MPPSTNSREFTIEDKILKGKVVPYDEEHTSIGAFILSKLEANPDLVGQIDVVTGKSYTYKTMRERSVRCALWLSSQGLRPRDVVALHSDDHLDYSMALFAVQYLGAVFTPTDIAVPKQQFIRRLKMTKPKVVFATKGTAAVVAEAAKEAELDLKIIVFGCVPGFLDFESIIAEPGVDEVEKFSNTSVESSDEIAAIIFSSGTTGLPKGIALSQKALISMSQQAAAIGMLGKVCLTLTSTDWIISPDAMLTCLRMDTFRLILPQFEEHLVCATIEKYKVNWLHLAPSLINKILKSDAVDRYDLSSLTYVLHGGMKLSMESYSSLSKLLPQAQITANYGSTEACASILIQFGKSQSGSCGRIMENCQLKVIDTETKRILGANEKGELLVKSACMMTRYIDNPQATREAIDEDGWLHTGDLGYFDERGEVFLVDRIMDTIRLADVDISPSEIEGVICSHPGVKDVAVVGRPRPDDGDLVMAFVVREDSVNGTKPVTEQEIIDLIAAKLPEDEHLSGGVRFIDCIPKTASNKIRRNVLRDLARVMV